VPQIRDIPAAPQADQTRRKAYLLFPNREDGQMPRVWKSPTRAECPDSQGGAHGPREGAKRAHGPPSGGIAARLLRMGEKFGNMFLALLRDVRGGVLGRGPLLSWLGMVCQGGLFAVCLRHVHLRQLLAHHPGIRCPLFPG